MDKEVNSKKINGKGIDSLKESSSEQLTKEKSESPKPLTLTEEKVTEPKAEKSEEPEIKNKIIKLLAKEIKDKGNKISKVAEPETEKEVLEPLTKPLIKEDEEEVQGKIIEKSSRPESSTSKIFDIFITSDVKVEDPGLRRYINLHPKLIVKTKGREGWKKFGKGRVNIVERIINLLAVPGHRGKKHRIMTKTSTGKYSRDAMILIKVLKDVEKKTNQNPIQVLIKAIENAAPCDEVTGIEYGGARYAQAVDCSPLRRLNLALRNLVHGAYDKSFNKKKTIAEALAEEILFTAEGSRDSLAIGKRYELQKQADSAR